MIAYSDHDKDLLLANTARTYSRLTFYKNGQQLIVCTEDDYLQEWDYEDYRYVPEQGFVGQFVERILDGKLINLPLDIDISDAEFKMEVGIKDPQSETVNYYDYGNFLITKVSDTDTNGTVSFEACDYTKKFNKVYEDRIEYPCTAGQLLMDVCDQAGVEYSTGSGTAVAEYMHITEGDAEYPAGAYSLYLSDTGRYLNFTSTRPIKRLESIANITSDTRYLYHNYIDTDGAPKRGMYRYTQATTATGTILQSTKSYDGMFTNCDFVIENNQFGENATCRDVIKAIAQLAMSWARVGIDNKLYLDFQKRTTSNVNTYTTLGTDNYYKATKTGDTYGPVTDVVIGMSSVEGENITKVGPLLDGTVVDGSNLYIEDGESDKTAEFTLKGNLSQKSISLPSEYTRVTYIQSSGGSAIDSGYKPTSNHLTISFRFNCQTGFYRSLTGAANSDDQEFAIQFFNGRFYVGTSRALLAKTYNINTDYETTIDAYNGTLTQILNGEKTSASYTGDLYKGASVGIFHTKTIDGWHSLYTDSARIYYYKLYDNNVLVRDFIPCYRNSDNAIGMYDLVEGKFYTNARNEGTFTKGSNMSNVVTPDPDHFSEVNVVTGDNNIAIEGTNIFNYNNTRAYGVSSYTTMDDNGWVTITYDNTDGTGTRYGNYFTKKMNVIANEKYTLVLEVKNVTVSATSAQPALIMTQVFSSTIGQFIEYHGIDLAQLRNGDIKKYELTGRENQESLEDYGMRSFVTFPVGSAASITFRFSVIRGLDVDLNDFVYLPYTRQVHEINLGKNLLNTSTLVTGQWYENGVLRTNNSWSYFNQKIPVRPNETYTLSRDSSSTTASQFSIEEFASDGRFVKHVSPWQGTGVHALTITTQPSTSYIYCQFNNTYDYANFMFEEKDGRSSYAPYFEPIELCKIGDYQDYFYKDSGKWYLHKEIGKVVLNGSESWATWYQTSNSNIGFYYYPTNVAKLGIEGNYNNALFNNRFSESQTRYYIYLGTAEGLKQCGETGTQYFALGIAKTRLSDWSTSANAISSLKSWLSSNNTTVYYVLATPAEEEITNSTLINQLEEIYRTNLFNNINHITTNTVNEKAILKLRYNATETTLEILDNPLTYTEELRRIAINSADNLLGLTYTPCEVDTIGYPWLDGDDYCKINDLDGDTYYTYPFNRAITYKGYIDSSIKSIADGKVQTEYKYEGDVDRRISRTEIIVDKHEGEIRAVTEQVDTVENDVSNLNTQYSDVLSQIDTTNTNITQLSSRVDAVQTSTYTKTEIQQIARGEGPDGVAVSVVSTMAGQFDINGMHYAKSGAPTQSTINQFGVEVNESNEDGTPGTSLLYAGYDYDTASPTNGESVVKVANINISDWTNIGLHGRFQDYTDEDDNEGIGFFLV